MTMDFKNMLSKGGPAALVLRQQLEPVEGPDGVFFPPTFAATEDGKFPAGYNIDPIGKPEDGRNVCIVDTVGSQANRIEPLFAEEGYSDLVPQIEVKAGSKRVSILRAGHRAADAIVRCSALRDNLHAAFKSLLAGDASPLAKVAPTSLIFGVWDSRDTQAKSPRLFASTIRAFDVRALTRSAVFVPSVDFVAEGLLDEPTDEKTHKLFSSRGFLHAPASRSHGGIIATGGVRREAVLHLAGLRVIRSGDASTTEKLQRYLLGLGLVALTAPPANYLRSGCNLVPVHAKPATLEVVKVDGSREVFTCTVDAAMTFARDSAKAFGVGPAMSVDFASDKANEDLAEVDKKKAKKTKGK